MADITVTTLSSDAIDNGDGETTLREAILAANAGDRIEFADGLTGTLTLTQGQLVLDKDITIDGDTNGDGKANVTISGDADGSGTGNAGDSRIFDLVAGTGTTNVELASLTLTGGYADKGGAIRGADQAVALILRNSTVDGNISTQSAGGGIGGGGGIYFSGALAVVNSTISNNSASFFGNGGGLALIYASAPTVLINTTIAGNDGGNDGGGIFLRGSDLAFEQVTITGNTANSGFGGGGIFMRDAANVILRNSVVAQNENAQSSNGQNIAEFSTLTSTITSENSFFEDGVTDWARFNGDFTTSFTDLGGTILNGGDPRLGALQDNGGPVATRAPLADSPLLDRGGAAPIDVADADEDGDTTEALPVDATGNIRESGPLDIGAVEQQRLLVTTSTDVVDANDGETSLREAITLAQASGQTVFFDLAPGDRTVRLDGQIVLDQAATVRIDGDIDGDGKGDVILSGDTDGDGVVDPGENRHFDMQTGTLRLESLTLTDGYSSGTGGSVVVNGGARLEALNVTFRDNEATGSGGAIFATGGGIVLGTNVTLTGNTSGSFGGGLYANTGNVTLTNATIHGNTSTNAGGGISVYVGSLSLLNATISGNTAGGGGGGIELYDSVNFTLHNSVLAGNTAINGPGQILDSGIGGASIVSAKNNFFETSEAADLSGGIGVSDGVNGNIVGGGDPGLLALADNGGPVETQAFAPESPLFDAGTAAEIPVDTLDADGDGNTGEGLPVSANGAARQVGSNPDIGAFEFPRDINNLVVDTLIDEDDGDYREGDLSLREAIDIAAAGATITFAQGITGGTTAGVDDGVITLNGTQLAINRDVTIDGDTNGDNRADITLDGNDASRVMRLSGETTDVALHSLAITGGNTAGVAGGIYASFLGSLLIADSTASGNRASLGGGFFLSSRTDLTMINTLITGNESGSYGGGLALDLFSTAELTNVTVQGNTTDGSGGGVFILESSATIHNSTISGNLASSDGTATTSGGGIWTNDGGNLTLTNTAVADNTSGGALPTPADDDVRGTITNATNSFIGTTETITNGTGNINGGGDAGLGALADNGGTTQTLALLPGSPLDGAGNAALLPADTLDIDGDTNTAEALPLDANGRARISDGALDIGAVEAVKPQSVVVDTLTDEDDGDFSAGDLSLREALKLVASGGEITFANGLSGTIALTEGTLELTRDVTIDGDTNGDDKADIALDGQDTHRVLLVTNGTAELSSLTLTGGVANASGGGVRIESGATVSLIHSTVSDNRVSSTSNTFTTGGGITSFGNLTLLNSTVSSNDVVGNGTLNSFANGGGLYLGSGGTTALINTTIFGNRAQNFGTSESLYAFGGGIRADRNIAALTIDNSTISGNRVEVSGTNYSLASGSGLYSRLDATISNSVIAGNIGSFDEVLFGQIYQGGNIVGNDVFNGSTDVGDASLADIFAGGTPTLADNGGPVETVEILFDGPAEGAGDATLLPLDAADLDGDGDTHDDLPLDANGDARVSNGALDLGAVEARQADLTVSDFQIGLVTNNTIIDGRTFNLQALVANNGAGASPDVFVEFFLSTDLIFDISDSLVLNLVDGMGSGETVSVSQGVTISGLTPGDYFLAATVDTDEVSDESDETNNTTFIPVTVVPDAPDLEWVAFAPLEADLLEGQTVDIGLEFINTGSTSSPTTGLKIYLSDDDIITTADTLIATTTAEALAAGGNAFNSAQVTLPTGFTGEKFIGAILDPDNTLLEQDETNNVSPAIAVDITPDLPDIVFRDFDLTAQHVSPGEEITVFVDLGNIGTQNTTTAGLDFSIYFSDDSTITTSDTLIHEDRSGFIIADGARSGFVTFTLPEAISGAGFIGAIIDPLDALDEVDETNNTSQATAVSVVDPTPTPGAPVVAETGTALIGATVPLTITLQNSFANPVVFAKLFTENEADAVTVRLSDVGAGEFTMRLSEPTGYDQVHALEKVSWMVVEEGDWILSDGTRLVAGQVEADGLANVGAPGAGFESVTFSPTPFDAAPVVQTQIQTSNDAKWVMARQKAATETGVEIGMQEDQTTDGIRPPEMIGWFAVDSGVGVWDGFDFVAGRTGVDVGAIAVSEVYTQPFDVAPALLTSLSRNNGVDPAIARVTEVSGTGFSVKAQEEISGDAEINHVDEEVDYFAIGAGSALLTARVNLPKFAETGTATLTHLAQTITLQRSYENPVVIATVATENGSDPVNVRVLNIDDDTLTLRLQEPNYLDGIHNAVETVNYMVVEAGTWILPDGALIEAGTLESAKLSTQGFETVAFDAEFDSTPVILSQVQTFNGVDFVTTRQQGPGTESFRLTMQEEEALNGGIHAEETIGWVAIEGGGGTIGDLTWAAGQTSGVTDAKATVPLGATLTGGANVIASLSSFSGIDPAWARGNGSTETSFAVSAEEERSKDAETSHFAPETVDYFAFNESGPLSSAPLQDIAETGTATLTHLAQTITLQRSYENPVVIATVATENGSDPVNVRVLNIDDDTLTLRLQEPNYLDGIHNAVETVNYMVVEAGTWILPDGALIEAGTLESAKLSTQGFETVAFDAEFDSTPVILSQVQTFNGVDFVTTRQQGPGTESFRLTMQEEEALNGGIHAEETIGWVAIEGGGGTIGDLTWAAGQTSGVTDAKATVPLGATLTGGANVIASLSSFSGIDPAWARGNGSTETSFAVSAEEERSKDAETSHFAPETVDYFAFDDAGVFGAYDYDFFL